MEHLGKRNFKIIPNIERSNTSFRFIHASDLHLGCDQYRNNYRSDDFIRAFEEILKLAIHHMVDFILLGGDIFTSLEILPEKLNRIVQILQDFINLTNGTIPLIMIEGNHDIRKFSRGMKVNHGQSWLKFLSNLGLVILLDGNLNEPPEQIYPLYDPKSNRGGKIQIKSAMIYGNRYLSQNPKEHLPKIREAIQQDDGLFHILLQHFGIEGQMVNVPGVKFQDILFLKDRVDYLALGHYHLQFILDDWIFNPGSSEAACSVDFSYKRGIFLVKVLFKERYIKQVHPIQLNNRRYLWKTILFKTEFRNREKLNEYIIQRLKFLLKDLRSNLQPSDCSMPFLFLLLKGKKPLNSYKIDEKCLRTFISESFPVVGVKIFQKFENNLQTIDKFF
ncbi:MAG: DNA repair exonuclease [Promethearchaeota archaeon]|nr:MAG: DNA repair exonuclease [Candidatus Lokiarchaeota archaeon]